MVNSKSGLNLKYCYNNKDDDDDDDDESSSSSSTDDDGSGDDNTLAMKFRIWHGSWQTV
jgi:hypothetical protein